MEPLTIPRQMKKAVRGAARDLGVSEVDFVTNAVYYYLMVVKRKIDLEMELELWERASGEDFIAFERALFSRT